MRMTRRTFVRSAPGLAAVSPAIMGCGAEPPPVREHRVAEIAGMPLAALREEYRADLFDRFLPFMERHVVDARYGGFMCSTLPDGTNVSTVKRAGYEGRGIWVYSFLYNNLAREQRYLDTAKRSVDFLLRHKPRGLEMWPQSFTREGEPESPPGASINADLYIADGLQEFAKASGDSSFLDLAREVLMKCLVVYESEAYGVSAGRAYMGKDAPDTPGIRIMDDWMLFLWTATQMLGQRTDMDLLMIVTQCLDTILHRFYHDSTGLVYEFMNHDYTRPVNALGQVLNTGNSVQAVWNVMAAAERIDNRDQFDWAAQRLMRLIEVAWDDVYGGMFNLCRDVDANVWSLAKAHYVQFEPLVGLMKIIGHTGDDRALDWFGRLYRYQREHFFLEKHGYPVWMSAADRKAAFVFERSARIENFHHPRYLMLNLLALDRLIERDGVPGRGTVSA